MSKDPLKLVIPKGSLEKATIELFRRAGWNITVSERSYFPSVDDDEIVMARLRAQEISRYVEMGTFDAGLTGKDWILENESRIQVIDDLVYSKVSQNPARWVLAVDAESDYHNPEDLQGKRIATELVRFTKRWFRRPQYKRGRGILVGQHRSQGQRRRCGRDRGRHRDRQHVEGQRA